jgi:hypothetical protein
MRMMKDRVIIIERFGALTPRMFSRPWSCSQPMDPRDLEFINELLEGEAHLKEVKGLSSYGVLSNSLDLHRGSASKVESLKRKHE